MIPYGRQTICKDDIDSVISVMRSDFLTQGDQVPLFESAICGVTDANHAIAANSATSALHIACLALGLGRGDLVWTTPISFVASANCALYCGAEIDFVDIDEDTFNLSPAALEKKLDEAKRAGRLPKVIIPVHMAGMSCEMQAIKELCTPLGICIIEDASHALGGSYHDAPIGSCIYSDITIFSSHPVKIITSGEGGMALTNDATLAKKMRLLRSHGVTREPMDLLEGSENPWHYEQQLLGYNYRMNDIEAALGISQASKLSEFIEARRNIVARYQSGLSDTNLSIPAEDSANKASAWHLYIVRLPEDVGLSRKNVFKRLKTSGIGVNVHYEPIHLQPYYQKLGFKPGAFPIAEKYAEPCLSLPIFPSFQEEDQLHTIKTLRALVT
jgi:UDP-4-amino-4,6-dideoxy-N-acetyl-beta-L-altrosamine transaminase